jgi:hypothetical protein
MSYRSTSAFVIAAAVAIASIATATLVRAQDGPGLENKTLHTSDIQYRFKRSPDNKVLSVLFDNFGVALAPEGGAPSAIRVVPLRIPVADADKGATVHVKAKGGLRCMDGTSCLAIVWVNGQTKVLNLVQNKASADFSAEADFELPGADVHQAAIILIAEREAKRKRLFRREASTMISIDSFELTIAPPPAANGKKK